MKKNIIKIIIASIAIISFRLGAVNPTLSRVTGITGAMTGLFHPANPRPEKVFENIGNAAFASLLIEYTLQNAKDVFINSDKKAAERMYMDFVKITPRHAVVACGAGFFAYAVAQQVKKQLKIK